MNVLRLKETDEGYWNYSGRLVQIEVAASDESDGSLRGPQHMIAGWTCDWIDNDGVRGIATCLGDSATCSQVNLLSALYLFILFVS